MTFEFCTVSTIVFTNSNNIRKMYLKNKKPLKTPLQQKQKA